MRCANCGAELPAAANYCPKCGANAWTDKARPGGDDDLIDSGRRFAEKAYDSTREALKTPKGKSVATHAAIGAVVALPLPVVGPIFGALVGGAIGWYRNRPKP